MLLYFLYLTAQFLAISLPASIKYWMAFRVSDLFFLFNKRAKQAVLHNLKNVRLPKDRFQFTEEIFHNFGKYLADFLSISQLNKHNWRKWVKLVNYESFNKAYKKGKGIIALTAHIGNWELGGVILSLIDCPISAVVLPQRNRAVNNIFVKQRNSKGLKPILLGRNFRECFRRLKNGEVLAILGDRNIRDKSVARATGVEVEFFGKKTHFPQGPAVLAYWTNALILPGFTIRGKDNKYTLFFEKPIAIERHKNKEKFVKVNTQKIATIIEKYVSRYPEQWCVFEEIWEEQ